MSPLEATSTWRAWPWPSCTTTAEKPAGSVSPSLSAATAAPARAQPAAAILTTRMEILGCHDLRMVDSLEFQVASTKVVRAERRFVGEAIVRAIFGQRNGAPGRARRRTAT